MLLKERHTTEGARAHATLVLLHLSVSLEVRTQVGAVSKCPVTVGAGKRTLSCVCADVTTQQPGSREGLSTCSANTGQSV